MLIQQMFKHLKRTNVIGISHCLIKQTTNQTTPNKNVHTLHHMLYTLYLQLEVISAVKISQMVKTKQSLNPATSMECCEQRESMVYNASAQERELTYCSYSQRYTLQKYQNISQRHVIQYIVQGHWQESSTATVSKVELI